MEQEMMPQWATYLLANQSALTSFIRWVEERKTLYAYAALNSDKMEEVKGCKFATAELDSWASMLMYPVEEQERMKHV